MHIHVATTDGSHMCALVKGKYYTPEDSVNVGHRSLSSALRGWSPVLVQLKINFLATQLAEHTYNNYAQPVAAQCLIQRYCGQ